ncbi:unnamed protein product [Symbiodinium microadriaticum]|nr:unnamed protein product [Symbiodinium microadriaticum]
MFDHAAAADFKRFLRRSRPHKKVEGRSGGEIVQAEAAEEDGWDDDDDDDWNQPASQKGNKGKKDEKASEKKSDKKGKDGKEKPKQGKPENDGDKKEKEKAKEKPKEKAKEKDKAKETPKGKEKEKKEEAPPSGAPVRSLVSFSDSRCRSAAQTRPLLCFASASDARLGFKVDWPPNPTYVSKVDRNSWAEMAQAIRVGSFVEVGLRLDKAGGKDVAKMSKEKLKKILDDTRPLELAFVKDKKKKKPPSAKPESEGLLGGHDLTSRLMFHFPLVSVSEFTVPPKRSIPPWQEGGHGFAAIFSRQEKWPISKREKDAPLAGPESVPQPARSAWVPVAQLPVATAVMVGKIQATAFALCALDWVACLQLGREEQKGFKASRPSLATRTNAHGRPPQGQLCNSSAGTVRRAVATTLLEMFLMLDRQPFADTTHGFAACAGTDKVACATFFYIGDVALLLVACPEVIDAEKGSSAWYSEVAWGVRDMADRSLAAVCLVLFVSTLVAVASRKYCCWRALQAKRGPHLFGLYTADDMRFATYRFLLLTAMYVAAVFSRVEKDSKGWNAFLPEGEVNVAVGYKEVVNKLLPRYGGPDAVLQWQALMAELKPMSDALYNSPPFGALRDDPFAPITLGRYARRLLPLFFGIPGAARLSQPFEAFLKEAGVTDDFVRNYLSLFSFLLQGLPSYGSPTSMMAYMMADLYRKGGLKAPAKLLRHMRIFACISLHAGLPAVTPQSFRLNSIVTLRIRYPRLALRRRAQFATRLRICPAAIVVVARRGPAQFATRLRVSPAAIVVVARRGPAQFATRLRFSPAAIVVVARLPHKP